MLAALHSLCLVPESLAEMFPRHSLTEHHSWLIEPPDLEPTAFCPAQLIHTSAETCPSLRPVVFTSSNCAATSNRATTEQLDVSSCLGASPPLLHCGMGCLAQKLPKLDVAAKSKARALLTVGCWAKIDVPDFGIDEASCG